MEMNLGADIDYVPSGADLGILQRTSQDVPSGTCSEVVVPARFLLASVVLGTSIFLTPLAMAATMPHFGTSPLVEDLRPAVTDAAVPRSADQGSNYRQILVQSFGHQAKEAMAALSLTKSQLAGVLRVSRPTVYEWLGGKEPSPGNARRLSTVLQLLVRAGISSETPLNARFVRHAIHERSSSLVELLCAEELDEGKIEDMLREVVALGQEAESQRVSREDRLRSLGYVEQSPEQRRDNLNQTVAMLDWPKR